MTQNTKRWLLASVAAALLALAVSDWAAGGFDAHIHEEEGAVEMIPEFSIPDINGGTLTSASLKGKVAIVNFWATWCAPCLVEIPEFIELQEAHPDDLQIVGLSLDESVEDVRGFADKMGMNYPVAVVEPGFDAEFGGAVGLPMSFVVDPEGRIVSRHLGLVPMSVYEDEISEFRQAR